MRFCESLPKFGIVKEVSKFSNQSDKEIDYNLPIRSSCKYYTVAEVQNLNIKDNFNLFHTNINGLESKFDNLHEFISFQALPQKWILLQLPKPLIITMNYLFKTKVSIEGYKKFDTPTKFSRGGTALYVKGTGMPRYL